MKWRGGGVPGYFNQSTAIHPSSPSSSTSGKRHKLLNDQLCPCGLRIFTLQRRMPKLLHRSAIMPVSSDGDDEERCLKYVQKYRCTDVCRTVRAFTYLMTGSIINKSILTVFFPQRIKVAVTWHTTSPPQQAAGLIPSTSCQVAKSPNLTWI